MDARPPSQIRHVALLRHDLAETLRLAGPGRPTLCDGWATEDLLAHLLLREHSPLDAAGIMLRPLAGRTERRQADLASRLTQADAFSSAAARFEAGPGRFSPMTWFDDAANLLEYVVHREDVRRAEPGWTVRPMSTALSRHILLRLRQRAGMLLRHAPVPVVLVSDMGEIIAREGPDAVVVRGDLVSLVLFAFGRDRAAEVEFDGPPAAIAALTGSDRSV